MIVIVDYGVGNLKSILTKFRRLEIAAAISSDPEEIAAAEKLMLPGVGHFGAGMDYLKRSGLVPTLARKVLEEKTPILGICLGMQLFARHSEEGDAEGLGWIDADVRRFSASLGLQVPHVGWNTLSIRKSSPILEGLDAGARFYFTHSYHMCCNDAADVLAVTRYGEDFVSVVQRENIFGTQFHPEKSHGYGIRLVQNFARLSSPCSSPA